MRRPGLYSAFHYYMITSNNDSDDTLKKYGAKFVYKNKVGVSKCSNIYIASDKTRKGVISSKHKVGLFLFKLNIDCFSYIVHFKKQNKKTTLSH